MKKLPVMLVALVVVVAVVGAGSYVILSHRTKPTSAPATTDAQSTAASTQSPKQLDLNTLLSNLKAKYPTIQQTYIYSENQDPNGNLGKAGYYTAGAEFYDTRTNTQPDGAAFGADSGGAIEVYANNSDAAKRIAYLQQFQGNPTLDPGAFKQVNNVVVRASSQYTGSEQADMINYLAGQVQAQLQ